MATSNSTVCAAFANSFPAFQRFTQSVQFCKGKDAAVVACHAFGRTDAEVLEGKATRGFAFASATIGFPQSALLRGDAAAVLCVFEAQETGKQFGVFVRQMRVPIGRSNFLELVAGMIDKKSDSESISVQAVIMKEMEEETGQTFPASEFFNLSKWQSQLATSKCGFEAEDVKTHGMVPSAGGCDEEIVLFCCVKTLPSATIAAMHGLVKGNAKEGERTRVCVIPLEDAVFVCKDSKFLSAMTLFRAYKEPHKMKSD